MLIANGREYKLYLLDTNAVSNLLKYRDTYGSNILNTVFSDGLCCFSPITIWELRDLEKIYMAG